MSETQSKMDEGVSAFAWLAAAKVSILIGFSLLLLTSRLRDRRSEWMPAQAD
jgi:hypothetical protein